MSRILVALLLLGLVGPACAQSLGEVAAQEKEKEDKDKRKPPAKKTFTDADLAKYGASDGKKASPSPGALTPADPNAGAIPNRSGEETQWRIRAASVHKTLAQVDPPRLDPRLTRTWPTS
jgi:hypothetical protein